MATTYGSGAVLPAVGSAAYSAAQSGSGYVSAASQQSSGGTPAPTVTTSGGGGSSTTSPTYTGVSIVDYLKSTGGASDYNSRATLAAQNGITNYTGTADQNTQLLNTLKSAGSTSNTGTSSTTYTPAGTSAPAVDANAQALKTATDKYTQMTTDLQNAQKQFSDTITNIQNGSIPLNSGEQAQVDALSASYNDLIAKQTAANTAAAGLANVRGYQTGAAEYDPNFQTRTIGAIASAGQTKLADLQTKKAGAIATLTQSLKNNDINAVKTAYAAFTKAETDSAAILQNTIKDTQTAITNAVKANSAQAEQNVMAIVLDDSFTLDQKKQALAQGMATGLLTPAQITKINAEIVRQENAEAKAKKTAETAYKTTHSADLLNNDISGAVDQFKTKIAQKGWAGVNPQDYKTMADYMLKEYGTAGITKFKTAVANSGLKVDTVNK